MDLLVANYVTGDRSPSAAPTFSTGLERQKHCLAEEMRRLEKVVKKFKEESAHSEQSSSLGLVLRVANPPRSLKKAPSFLAPIHSGINVLLTDSRVTSNLNRQTLLLADLAPDEMPAILGDPAFDEREEMNARINDR